MIEILFYFNVCILFKYIVVRKIGLLFLQNEDNADMKLDFAFDSDLSQLTDDKSSKGMGLPHSMQMVQSSTAAADSKLLNFKIASVKKVNV